MIKKYQNQLWKALFLSIGFGLNSMAAQAQTFVDKELILEIDVSDSISDSDMQLIFDGYANAFQDPVVQNLIERNTDGVLVGIQMFASGQAPPVRNVQAFFDGSTLSEIPTPNAAGGVNPFGFAEQWFLLKTANDAIALADIFEYIENDGGTVRRPPRTSNFVSSSANCSTEASYSSNIGRGTNIAGAIQQGTCELNTNTNPSDGSEFIANYERIIDISTDGIQNTNIFGSAQGGSPTLDNECNFSILQQGICQTALTTSQSQASSPSTIPGAGLLGITDDTEPIDRINAIGIDVDPTAVPNLNYVNNYLGARTDSSGNPVGYFQPTNALDPDGDTECRWDPDTGTRSNTGSLGTTPTPPCTAANSRLIGPVIQGDDAFVESATSFVNFNNPGIRNKIRRELEPVPFEFNPGLGLILGLGIFGYKGWKRSNQKEDIELESELEEQKEERKDLILK